MTPTSSAHSSQPSHANDLPPELSAFIDAAIARATARRPCVPIVNNVSHDAPLRLPRLNAPKKRTRVLSLDDLVLISLFVGLLLAAWISLLIGLDVAQPGGRTAALCAVQDQSASKTPAFERSACRDLPHQS